MKKTIIIIAVMFAAIIGLTILDVKIFTVSADDGQDGITRTLFNEDDTVCYTTHGNDGSRAIACMYQNHAEDNG